MFFTVIGFADIIYYLYPTLVNASDLKCREFITLCISDLCVEIQRCAGKTHTTKRISKGSGEGYS